MTRCRTDDELMPLQVEHVGGPACGTPYPATLCDYQGVVIVYPAERDVVCGREMHRYVLAIRDGRMIYEHRGRVAVKGGRP